VQDRYRVVVEDGHEGEEIYRPAVRREHRNKKNWQSAVSASVAVSLIG